MRKVVKWVKKWSLLLFVILIGTGYLTFFDHWQIYRNSLQNLQTFFENHITWKQEKLPGQVQKADATAGSEPLSDRTDKAETSDIAETGKEDLTDVSISGGDGGNTSEDTAVVGDNGMTVGGEVAYSTVDDSYFQDALFIGDSRTVGLYEYAEWEDVATFYASTGLTVYKMFDTPIVEVPGQRQKETVDQALAEKQFAKIYLMIGINEMGTGTVDSFMEAYEKAVRHLQELQPDAIIYLQGIMKVTADRSAKGDYITNEGIQERNDRIAQLADNRKIFYLDVNPLVCDESGGMNPGETFDGVHLKAQYISIWKEFLKSHAIE